MSGGAGSPPLSQASNQNSSARSSMKSKLYFKYSFFIIIVCLYDQAVSHKNDKLKHKLQLFLV